VVDEETELSLLASKMSFAKFKEGMVTGPEFLDRKGTHFAHRLMDDPVTGEVIVEI
jgi:hypothetical protein